MFIVIQDSREQKPLVFESQDVSDIIIQKIDTGDYTILGLEDKLFVERKASVLELYKNITEKRFWEEMERTRSFKYRYLIAEFDLEDIELFPYGCGLPREQISKLKMGKDFIYKNIIERIMLEYDIQVIFAGNPHNAAKVLAKVMKYVCEKEK